MEQTFSDKMRWLSILGAVAMLMTHAGTLQFYPGAEPWAVWAVQVGTELAVPAVAWFFFSAGYWLFRGLTGQSILPRLKRRFFSLVVPFFAWNALVLAAECAQRALKHEPITASYLLRAFAPIVPVNGALWFVARLVSYVVFLPAFYVLMQKRRLSQILVAAGAALCMALRPDYYSFFYWLPVFCMGGWLAVHGHEKLEAHLAQKGRLPWGAVLFAYILLIILLHPAMQAGGRSIYFVRMLSAPMVILLAGLARCPAAKGWFWAQLSFFLFCTHWYIEALLGGKLAKLIPAGIPGAALWCYALLCMVTLVLAVAALRLMHRFTPRTLAVLTGGRTAK